LKKRLIRYINAGYRFSLIIDVDKKVKNHMVDVLVTKHLSRPLQTKFKKVLDILVNEEVKSFKRVFEREIRKTLTPGGKKR
jgi:hypothetical protein